MLPNCETVKRSDMGCAKMQAGLFRDLQDSHILSAKSSYMSSAIEKEGPFAEAQ